MNNERFERILFVNNLGFQLQEYCGGQVKTDRREFISKTFEVTLFPEEIYFFYFMPSEININSIILIALCSIITTIIVSIYPASKAASLDMIKTLKYE